MGDIGGTGSCRWENSSLMNHPDSTQAYVSASEAHIRLSPPGKKAQTETSKSESPSVFLPCSFIHSCIHLYLLGGRCCKPRGGEQAPVLS